jgi:hypothetical protein
LTVPRAEREVPAYCVRRALWPVGSWKLFIVWAERAR